MGNDAGLRGGICGGVTDHRSQRERPVEGQFSICL